MPPPICPCIYPTFFYVQINAHATISPDLWIFPYTSPFFLKVVTLIAAKHIKPAKTNISVK